MYSLAIVATKKGKQTRIKTLKTFKGSRNQSGNNEQQQHN